MFFNKKKAKGMSLPFVEQPVAAAPPPSVTPSEGQAGNEVAAPFPRSSEDDGRLKTYAIYYRDRELAQTKGDPMMSVIQAYSQAEAQVEALKMQKEGCEILTIQSNEAVAYTTQAIPAALPARRLAGQISNKPGGAGSVFRSKHNLLRGF